MALSLPGSIPIPLIFVILILFIGIIVIGYAFFLTLFALQIPNVFQQIKAQMKRSALVLVHYSNRRAEFFSPKREGKKKHKNTLTFPKALGTKFDASGQGLEEVLGKSVLYNYYSKACHPVPADQAKAVHDFRTFCGEKGIEINEELIDVLFVENLDIKDVYTKPLLDKVLKNLPLPIRTFKEAMLDEDEITAKYNQIMSEIQTIKDKYQDAESEMDKEDLYRMEKLSSEYEQLKLRIAELDELKAVKEELTDTVEEIESLTKRKHELIDKIDIITGYLDEETHKRIYTLTRMKEDLQKRVIRDGSFVFPKVHELIFAASALNSAGMSEAIAIAEADAHQQNLQEDRGMDPSVIMMFIVAIIILFAGIGITYKIMFG